MRFNSEDMIVEGEVIGFVLVVVFWIFGRSRIDFEESRVVREKVSVDV